MSHFSRKMIKQVQVLQNFRKLFGNDDSIYILIKTDNFFTQENIHLVKQMVAELKEQVPYVKEVKYIGNVEYLEGTKENLLISKLIDNVPSTKEEIDGFKKKAIGESLYVDNYISKDGKLAGIVIDFEQYPNDVVDPRKKIPPAVYVN